jgi:hypothetical protein
MIPPPFCRRFLERFGDNFFGALRFIPPPFMLLARFFFEPFFLHPHDGMLQRLWHADTFKL